MPYEHHWVERETIGLHFAWPGRGNADYAHRKMRTADALCAYLISSLISLAAPISNDYYANDIGQYKIVPDLCYCLGCLVLYNSSI